MEAAGFVLKLAGSYQSYWEERRESGDEKILI